MGRIFGTDGVRGLANRELTADMVVRLCQSAALVLTKGRHADELKAEGRRPRAVMARDPRISGEFLGAAVAAGLASSGSMFTTRASFPPRRQPFWCEKVALTLA